LISGSRWSDPLDAETLLRGDVGDVRAVTGECELRRWADAGGESVAGYGIWVGALQLG
jgi:hypothetical protein